MPRDPYLLRGAVVEQLSILCASALGARRPSSDEARPNAVEAMKQAG